MELKIGQPIFLSNEFTHTPAVREHKIEKIGRKWVECSGNARFDKETMAIDGHGYSSPGFAFSSKEAFEQKMHLKAVWIAFRRAVEFGGPTSSVTVADIEAAAVLLKVTLKVE